MRQHARRAFPHVKAPLAAQLAVQRLGVLREEGNEQGVGGRLEREGVQNESCSRRELVIREGHDAPISAARSLAAASSTLCNRWPWQFLFRTSSILL